jgi:hypothetical protein
MNGADDPPAMRTVVNPLTETEAREFISAQVKGELDKYKRRLFAIFGITNVVALITIALAIAGMWFTIQNAATSTTTATTTATTMATQTIGTVQPIVQNFAEKFVEKTTEFENDITSLQKEFKGLPDAVRATEQQAAANKQK